MNKYKTSKQMERHLKGMSNHYRIEILLLIGKRNGITLDNIIKTTDGNPKTIGEHTRRLAVAGLVNKKYKNRFVEHYLSPYGKVFYNFLKSFRSIK